MTALDGIVNYLFYSNASTEEVKASKDQTTKTVIPPKQKEGIIIWNKYR